MKTIKMMKVAGTKPSVRKVVGVDPQCGLALAHCRCTADYGRKNSHGSRVIYQIYRLEDGVYELQGGVGWERGEKRRWYRVIGSDWLQLSFEEAVASARNLG